MVVPNFLIVGAAKAGTSALFQYLRQHPDIYMAPAKELRYFGAGEAVHFCGPGDDRRPPQLNFEQYKAQFRPAGSALAIGEASVQYLEYPSAAREIATTLSSVKIVVMLRNPIDRAFSTYGHKVRDGWEKLPFDQAIKEGPKRVAQGWDPFWDYLGASRYSPRLTRYLELFGRERVKVILYEDLRANRAQALADVCEFLGVAKTFDPGPLEVNVSGRIRSRVLQNLMISPAVHQFRQTYWRWAPARAQALLRPYWHRLSNWNVIPLRLDRDTRATLLQQFEPEIQALESLLGLDLSVWRA